MRFCEEWYHGSCLKLNENDIKKLKAPGFEWKCPTCEVNDSKQKKSTETSNKNKISNLSSVIINKKKQQIHQTLIKCMIIEIKRINIKGYQCHKCSKIFVDTKSLLNHFQTTHMHSCKWCKEKFALARCVKEHEKMHTGGKPHFCNYCKKTIDISNYKKLTYIGEHS